MHRVESIEPKTLDVNFNHMTPRDASMLREFDCPIDVWTKNEGGETEHGIRETVFISSYCLDDFDEQEDLIKAGFSYGFVVNLKEIMEEFCPEIIRFTTDAPTMDLVNYSEEWADADTTIY